MLCCERHPNPVAIFCRVQIWWCNQRASLKATFGCVSNLITQLTCWCWMIMALLICLVWLSAIVESGRGSASAIGGIGSCH